MSLSPFHSYSKCFQFLRRSSKPLLIYLESCGAPRKVAGYTCIWESSLASHCLEHGLQYLCPMMECYLAKNVSTSDLQKHCVKAPDAVGYLLSVPVCVTF